MTTELALEPILLFKCLLWGLVKSFLTHLNKCLRLGLSVNSSVTENSFFTYIVAITC